MLTALDKHTALVIIDLQKGIAGMKTVIPSEEIIKKSAQLAEAFRKEKLCVIVVNVDPFGSPSSMVRAEQNTMPKDEAAQRERQQAMDAQGFFDIVDELGLKPEDLRVTKKTWNAFFNTPLHDELQKRGITGIVLAGISTSIGVEGTARAAFERGYNVTFATDAMTDMVADAHERSMKYIFPRMGELDTTENIISKLAERDA